MKKCNLLVKANNYALVELDNEYAVVYGYDETQRIGERWARSEKYFTFWDDETIKAKCLQKALDYFREKTEEKNVEDKYVLGQNPNTKDWFVYDDEVSSNVCVDTRENCIKYILEHNGVVYDPWEEV